ncbi:MAG: exodeoxyribonuclease VII large subunit [Ruminococcaceae bacterium]|nr:exodeoxyribonuclease VII large subunit [Oscillospiraceae bacterium]
MFDSNYEEGFSVVSERERTISVTQLNNFIKNVVEQIPALERVSVKGEISNCTIHRASGHIYFSLKDEGSIIKAVMFKGYASRLDFKLENGMKVVCHGKINVFVRDGQYSLYVDSVKADGVGSLYEAFEKLKKKLEAEGLFDPAHKKKLPKIPLKVGVITSATGAAVRDIINVSGRRFPLAKVYVYPSTVQGPTAAPSMIKAIDYFCNEFPTDVLIIGRGGGSLEELWAFNDEKLARAIYNCRIPIISAVGHETDFTIADFVADLRAPTPSAAAEIAVPDRSDILRMLSNVQKRTRSVLKSKTDSYRRILNSLAGSSQLKNPKNYFDQRRQYLISLEEKIDTSCKRIIEKKRSSLNTLSANAKALNPLGVLKRGYAAVFSEGGKVITSSDSLEKGDRVNLQFSDGTVQTTVDGIKKGE